MTSDQADVVRTFLDLVAARDYDRMSEVLDPDVVMFGTRGGLDEDQVLRGPDAVFDYLREIEEPWQRFDFEVERFIEAGERVVAFLRETGEARHGGLEVHNDTAMIFKVRAMKVVEMTGYLDRDEALRAAGMAE